MPGFDGTGAPMSQNNEHQVLLEQITALEQELEIAREKFSKIESENDKGNIQEDSE